MISVLEAALERSAFDRELFFNSVVAALTKAGNISRLSAATGIRRQSLALWQRRAVCPTRDNMFRILAFLKRDDFNPPQSATCAGCFNQSCCTCEHEDWNDPVGPEDAP